MKKSRPGVVFCALADEARADSIEALIFAETRTLGVRRHRVRRTRLERREERIDTSFGAVRVKFARGMDGVPRSSPEYDDVARVARERGVPLREAMEGIRRELPPWPE